VSNEVPGRTARTDREYTGSCKVQAMWAACNWNAICMAGYLSTELEEGQWGWGYNGQILRIAGMLYFTKMYWLLGFQHRNSRTLPIESFAHDSERTLVRAEYGYPKGSPYSNSSSRNPSLQLSIQSSPQRTSKRPSSEHHWATRKLAIGKTPAKWSAYRIPSVIVVFVILPDS
jgi:hypothetical protein